MKGGPIHLTQKLMTSSSIVEQTAAFKLLTLEIIELLNHCLDTTAKVLIAPMACVNMKVKCGILSSNRILSKVQKSFWSCTHVNSFLKYALYVNLHSLLNILSKTTLDIQESRKSIE